MQSIMLCLSHLHVNSYEAETFPGLVYRMAEPKVALLIFVRYDQVY